MEYRTEGITINCLECGKEKYVYINTKWGKPKFCSLLCWDAFRRKNKKEVIITCTNCKKDIKMAPSRSKINKKLFFCNRECQLDYWGKKLKEKLSNCNYCGKEIFALPVNKKGREKSVVKFCNYECFIAYKRENKKVYKKICEYCGKEYDAKSPGQFKKRKFCSHSCSGKNAESIRRLKGIRG